MGLILQSLVTCLFVTYVQGLEFRFPSDNACIIAQMDATFTLFYDKESSKLKEPQLDESKSICGNGSTATLALKWTDTNDTMAITFNKGVEKVHMRSVYEFIPIIHFKDSKNNTLIVMDGPEKELSMSNMSYKCDSPQILNFVKGTSKLVMSVAKVQVQAFEVEKGNFSNFEECSEDSSTTENPAPETTTHHSQTTTGSQTTVNPPKEDKYKYPSNDSACIMLKSAIQLSINYTDENNATVTTKVNVPNHLDKMKVTGQCAVNDTGNAFLMLNWDFKTSSKFSLKMDFIADKEAKLNKMEVKGEMSQADFPGLPGKSKNVTSIGSVDSFESSKLTYYKCNSPQEVKLDNITMVLIDKIQVQAFGVKKTFTGDGTECSQDFSTENPTTVTMPTHTTRNATATADTIVPITTLNETTTASAPVSNSTMTTSAAPVSNSTMTASTAPISTTAAPPHPTNTYSVHDGNVTCVYFIAGMDFTFPYTTKNGTNTSAVINVPQNFQTNGTCSTQNETMNETFNELNIYFYSYSWNLIFVFGPDNSSSQLGDMQFKTYSVKKIALEYKMDPTLFPGYKENDNATYHTTANFTGSLFQSKVNGTYKCNVDTAVPFTGNIKLTTYNLQYKAFNQDNSTNFGGELSECSGDNNNDNKTNSVVPIAVGAALAGLVVIVLIAYLIGRRRNRKGYESV